MHARGEGSDWGEAVRQDRGIHGVAAFLVIFLPYVGDARALSRGPITRIRAPVQCSCGTMAISRFVLALSEADSTLGRKITRKATTPRKRRHENAVAHHRAHEVHAEVVDQM